MCGRYSLTNTTGLDERFNAEYPDEGIRPRYNAAPSQKMVIIPQSTPHHMQLALWGFPISWIKDRPEGLINIRAETISEKPSFKKYLKEGRCLILADGFYEWKKIDTKTKQPYRITLKDEKPFAFAGVYKEAEGKLRFAIITTTPNSLMKDIHNRMPVILEKKEEQEWLMGPQNKAIEDMLSDYPPASMKAYAVSKLVNTPMNDTPQIIRPVSIV